jgi:hypothetical protein
VDCEVEKGQDLRDFLKLFAANFALKPLLHKWLHVFDSDAGGVRWVREKGIELLVEKGYIKKFTTFHHLLSQPPFDNQGMGGILLFGTQLSQALAPKIACFLAFN